MESIADKKDEWQSKNQPTQKRVVILSLTAFPLLQGCASSSKTRRKPKQCMAFFHLLGTYRSVAQTTMTGSCHDSACVFGRISDLQGCPESQGGRLPLLQSMILHPQCCFREEVESPSLEVFRKHVEWH